MSETSVSAYRDELGPEKVIFIHDAAAGLDAILVVDNVAIGPSIGGVRMAPDVTPTEVFRLARAMTFKNAAAGLPHGGGKAGILASPGSADKERLVRTFARAIREIRDYIPGPDMGTDETCMAWIHDEIGRAVGLPAILGGIPLDEIGATGFGLANCAEVAAPFCGIELQGARVAIEGFGNVGRHAARFLEERGAMLVAASDSRGGIYNPDGMRTADVWDAKRESGTVSAFGGGTAISQTDLFGVPCDILVPAARPDCIHASNAPEIHAKLILSGANIPATPEAEQILHDRGILIVPDFIANAGGVICASVEYHGGTEAAAFAAIADKIRRNAQAVLDRSKREGILPRKAAVDLAQDRVREAMKLRRSR